MVKIQNATIRFFLLSSWGMLCEKQGNDNYTAVLIAVG